MKYFLVVIFLFFCFVLYFGQAESDSLAEKKVLYPKWNTELNISQYSASLLFPSFSKFHPGLNAVGSYSYNKNESLQFRQDFIVGFFYHQRFQSVLQLYSEFNFKIKFFKRMYWSPLVIGGGYLASILNMQSFTWDGSQYIVKKSTVKNNWLISLGTNIEIPTNIQLFQRHINLTLKYRIQIQGTIIKNNVPIIAYSPLSMGINVPINKLNDED